MNFYSHLKLPLLATALLVSASAWAADYDPPIVVDEAPEFVPVEIGSGWYLRGDVGYSFERTEADFSGLPGIDVSRGDFGGGGGVGYHFTDFIRGDINLAFLGRDSFTFNDGVDFARLKTQSWSGMANVYLDLGTYSGLTPYVGAGLGILYTRSRFEADIAGIGVFDLDDDQSKFAYSLGAGFAYKVAQTGRSISVISTLLRLTPNMSKSRRQAYQSAKAWISTKPRLGCATTFGRVGKQI